MTFDVDQRDRIIAALKAQIATYREQSVIDAITLGDKEAEIEQLRAELAKTRADAALMAASFALGRALEPKP